METLVKKVLALRAKCKEYSSDVCGLLGIPSDSGDPRENCFGMVFNHATLCYEILSYYHSLWKGPRPVVAEPERVIIIRNNAERCIMVGRDFYIHALSSIEYSAKASVNYYGKTSPVYHLIKAQGQQRIYLGAIMQRSKNSGLISNGDYGDWDNLIDIRNCVIHNNAIPDDDKVISIGKVKVTAEKEKPFQGNIATFPGLTEVAVDRYFSWIKAVIGSAGK